MYPQPARLKLDQVPMVCPQRNAAMTPTTSTRLPASGPGQAASTPLRTGRWLALGTVAGPLLFTLIWLILGFLSPGLTFSDAPDLLIEATPITAPISGLGLGPTGPYMNAAFVLGGLLTVVGVLGVFHSGEIAASGRPAARWSCAGLLALTGVGMVVAGIFTLESFFPHFVGFLLATGTPVLSFVVAGSFLRGLARWRRFGTWLCLASPLTLTLLVLSQVTFDQATIVDGEGIAGLTSRALALEVLAWFAALGWLAYRRA
jgi:hypothetical protein